MLEHRGDRRRTSRTLCAVSWLVLLTAGSCSPYHMYSGPERSSAERSTLTTGSGIVLMTIDGGDTGVSSTFLVPPGRHRIEVTFRRNRSGRRGYSRATTLPGTCWITADTAGGRSYVIEGSASAGGTWQAWMAELGSDAPIASCEF